MQAKMNSRNNKRGRRIRVTKAEIERARQELLREEASRPGPIPRQQMDPRGFWRKGIYHDSYGWSWDLDKNLGTICLGRTEEVLQRESSFRREKGNRSCHSKLKTGAPSISGSGAKSVVASFRNDPRFLRLLRRLISQGYGIRTAHSKLTARGYEIPLRTLGRWIRQLRAASGE